MNSREFLKEIFRSGIATDEEIAKYMLKNYFLKGKTFDDFEEDIRKLNKGEYYPKGLRESFEDNLKRYSK
jgi:hypothetical protein